MRQLPTVQELEIATLGSCRHPSPLPADEPFVDEGGRVLVPSVVGELAPYLEQGAPMPSFEPAGPRARLFFEPSAVTCGILTCGGLCPGLNDVLRSLVLRLTYAYGVRRVLGFRYGYAGLAAAPLAPPMDLVPDNVANIHEYGGTLLGSSRGPQDLGEMAATLARYEVSVLFVIGGDGGLRGASALSGELQRRGLPISVVGVPKTIDNDLDWIWQSFGYATAVDTARTVLATAHVEARGAWNGIGLVKLMGRHSGFIAAGATLASADVNFCLIPEVPFSLEGRGGFLEALEARLDAKRHAVVVVAEGAGQELMPATEAADASGNQKLGDIGLFLRKRIAAHFEARGKNVPIRYIDPSYSIRSMPTNASDSQYCLVLGQHAAHAGMAGKTDMVVGFWNQRFTHLPISLAVRDRRLVDPGGEIWQRVLETTGQPRSLLGR